MPAKASRRPPWQNPRHRRQAAAGAGVLLLGYAVLFFVALLGGPRIGAGFIPLPGGGPKPAAPIAGPQPGEPTQNVAVLPPRTTPTPAATPGALPTATAVATPLPTATMPGETQRPVGTTSTPYPTLVPGTPTPQIVETTDPTIPVATKRPPTVPTAPPTNPTTTPTARPTTSTTPTAPPPTSTTPSPPPTTPTTPDNPGGLGGILGSLLDKLGL
ncbi:hypothetical protein [Kribbella sindirgiensis]|uniref:Uncharacterized protein n=1 Tax=Kribbella sindirgiensis TaxID=1124744 RepID=A0A4R0JAI4_9ACTN|nr:hypothetical protein [Kribbella sindirgiensis]TCC42947.1 hypothetical protein E0H50_00170 [Kribbella sindirgiensis]